MTHKYMLRVGTIIDADGQPVPGAHLTVHKTTGQKEMIASATSDRSGVFPMVEVEHATVVGVEVRYAADGPLIFSWDDLQIPAAGT